MKFLASIMIASLSAYAQHGHSSGGMGHAGGMPTNMSSPAGGVQNSENGHIGSAGVRSAGQTRTSQQPPDAVLDRNTKLSSKLDSLLPAGTTAQQACSGFKNLGDCVSAIHVSHNLGIPFDEVKGKLIGSTPEKLGMAIHELKPDANAKAEVKKAHKQTKGDLETSEQS